MKKAVILLMVLLSSAMLAACGKKDSNTSGGSGNDGDAAFGEASMEDLKAAVVDVLGENYWPNMAMEEEMFSQIYGVTSDMYEEYFAETPMISTNVDTLIIVKAKEGKVSAIEDALNAYRDNLVNDTMQYPMNISKIQSSRIETFGNYVCFVQLGADVSDVEEEAAILQCQEENEKAIDAIRAALSK
ncbi:MAG: DUF4358 domain-containing protein [Lachnospiraceae bacterium]|nr:DUF4358 domain-containing protein [Lachnospiraceae bacterium]